MIVGIDEVGRGPWAGPIVFGAVVLGDADIAGLTDSKKLSKKRREALNTEIYSKAKAVGLGWVSANELDELGMSEALKLGCRRALEQIKVSYQQIILDGTINFLKDTGKGPYVTTMKQADLLVPSVSAASIVAKVARDQFMAEQNELYPGYGFASHVGYGTSAHAEALQRLGPTSIHRMSFAPLAQYDSGRSVQSNVATSSSANRVAPTTIGNRAEDAATAYLESRGFRVAQRNWKTKVCEIDIVAEKAGIIYFVEVKYRRGTFQGGGLAAITPAKVKQMSFAAEVWFKWYGMRVGTLSALEVSGDDYEITQFVEQVQL